MNVHQLSLSVLSVFSVLFIKRICIIIPISILHKEMKILYRRFPSTLDSLHSVKTLKSTGYINEYQSSSLSLSSLSMPPKSEMFILSSVFWHSSDSEHPQSSVQSMLAWAQLHLLILHPFWHVHLISNSMDSGAAWWFQRQHWAESSFSFSPSIIHC